MTKLNDNFIDSIRYVGDKIYKDMFNHCINGQTGLDPKDIKQTLFDGLRQIQLYSSYKDDIDIEMNPYTIDVLFASFPEYYGRYEPVHTPGRPRYQETFCGFDIDREPNIEPNRIIIRCSKSHKYTMRIIPGPFNNHGVIADMKYLVYDYNNIEPLMKFLRDEGDEIEMKLPKKYIVNSDAAILIDNNDKKTIVKRHKEDTPDPVKGFLWAYFIKNSGLTRTKANQYLEKIKEDYIDEVSKKKKQNKNKKKKTR